MENNNKEEVAFYNKVIQDIDNQILVLSEKKRQLNKERQEILPSALDTLMNSKKRKREQIETSKEYLELKTFLAQQKKDNEDDKNGKIFEELTQDERGLIMKPKLTRRVYNEETKKLTIKLTEKFSKQEISNNTGISVENIKKWKKQSKTEKGITIAKRGKRVLYPDLEDEIKSWIKNQRDKKNHVSVRRLLREARSRAAKQNKTGLKFTWGWVNKFLKRNKFKLRKPTTKISEPENKNKEVEDFARKIKILVDSGLYDLDHVVNVDETGICCEEISTKTICSDEEEKNKGRKSIKHPTTKSVNKDKENLTVVLAGSWTGKKLPAMIIFPDKGVKKLDRDVPENICKVHREQGSYMDRETMNQWVNKVLNPYSRKLPPNKKGLLILDNFAGHISSDIKKAIQSYKYDVETLPPNTTKYLQPLDLAVNRPFKMYMSDQWENYAANLTEKDVTKKNHFLAPSRGVKMLWVSRAWTEVKSESIANGFNIFKNSKLPDQQEQPSAKIETVEEKPKELCNLYKDDGKSHPSEQMLFEKFEFGELSNSNAQNAENNQKLSLFHSNNAADGVGEDIGLEENNMNGKDYNIHEALENLKEDFDSSSDEEDSEDEDKGNLHDLNLVNDKLLDYLIESQDEA